MRVPRTEPDPAPQGSKRPPAYANQNSHWWDCSQLYGCDATTEKQVRTMIRGKLTIEPTGLLPVEPVSEISISGFTDNWWIGLAMLHTLFTWEHNYICDLLAHHNPAWTDQQLFAKARLITTALIAKIHTVEWTCADDSRYLVAINGGGRSTERALSDPRRGRRPVFARL
jgi:Animal haem peroxidase